MSSHQSGRVFVPQNPYAPLSTYPPADEGRMWVRLHMQGGLHTAQLLLGDLMRLTSAAEDRWTGMGRVDADGEPVPPPGVLTVRNEVGGILRVNLNLLLAIETTDALPSD